MQDGATHLCASILALLKLLVGTSLLAGAEAGGALDIELPEQARIVAATVLPRPLSASANLYIVWLEHPVFSVQVHVSRKHHKRDGLVGIFPPPQPVNVLVLESE